MKWHTEKRRVKDLREHELNPRKLSKKQKKDLQTSLERFSLAEIPAINTDNTIIAGHQRISLLKEKNPETEIEVRVPERQLTAEEVKEYMIRSNKNTGEFDYQMLEAYFGGDELIDYGFEKSELPFLEDNPPEVTKKVCKRDDSNYILIKFNHPDDYYKFLDKHGLKEGQKLKFEAWMQ